MKIPVMDKPKYGRNGASADQTPNNQTPEKDAGEVLEEVNQNRNDEQEMQQQQGAGEVDTQTKEHDPRNTPDEAREGMESSPTGVQNADTPDYAAQMKYLAADFENFKRQAARREQEARDRAVQNTLMQILPVVDNFHLAVLHANTAKDVASLKVGLDFIAQQLDSTLRGLGLEPIDAKGREFDPLRHEALEQIEADAQPGTVVEETQRGYVYKGNVLRTSRVKVAK